MAKQVIKQAGMFGAMVPMVLVKEDPVLSMGRHGMIAREAYQRAEQRGFQGGDPLTGWKQKPKSIAC